MYCQSTFLPVWGRCLYCQSTTYPVWGCCLYCQSTTLMHLKSHINRCCQVSPNMLSKHHQSWGSYTCQMSPNVLSKYQQFWGSHVNSGLSGFHCTVRVPSFPVWGCCLYCQSTNLMHLKVTSTVVAECLQICCPKHHQSWGSCTFQCLLMYCPKYQQLLRESHQPLLPGVSKYAVQSTINPEGVALFSVS